MKQLPDKKTDSLASLINKNLLDSPSENFTSDVMFKLGLTASVLSTKVQPVISIKGWVFVWTVILVLFYFALSNNNVETNPGLMQLRKVNQTFLDLSNQLFTGSFTVKLTLASIAVLMLFSLEAVYRRRLKQY